MTCLGDSLLAALLLRPFSSQTAWAAMPSLNACLLSGSSESELNSLEKTYKTFAAANCGANAWIVRASANGATRADSYFHGEAKVIIANGLMQATEFLGVRLRV